MAIVKVKSADRLLRDELRESPVDRVHLRLRRMALAAGASLLLAASAGAAWMLLRDVPVTYANIEEHFKYGSIGSEPGGSLTSTVGGLLPPYKVFKALPAVCPERAPGGYPGLGMIVEKGRDLPIGLSRRFRLGLDLVGVNCALCHTGTYRGSPADERHVVLGMPANRLKLQRVFGFVLDCVLDDRFTPDGVVAIIEANQGSLGWTDRFIYRNQVVPRVRETVVQLRSRVGIIMSDRVTPWGAGRVDTFNPYKALQFHWHLDTLPVEELMGATDYPSLWNQRPRDGMHLHWDGNNDSVEERNLSASLGAGVTPVTVDHESLQRVRDWIWTLPPPAYPFAIDRAAAARGAIVYREECRACHASHRFKDGVVDGELVGKVTPLDEIGTDSHRWKSYTFEFSENQYTLYPSSPYRFTHFRKTDGYANQPLDGIWLRAPYLHNGSVPSVRELLEPPERRPARFYRGNDVYDRERLGFVSNVPAEGDERFDVFDTTLPGNGNQGHLYGTDLSAGEKDDLVEYMKTF